MKLYHGTNQDFDTINLSKGLRCKDFGKGFYLTPNEDTAQRMAEKRVRLFGGKPYVIVYEFDEELAHKMDLRIKKFSEKATLEWAEFIDLNRSQNEIQHSYDIICGPIADDGVAYQLGRYHEGTSTLEEIATGLQDKYLDQQYFFGTQRALQCLSKIETICL